MQNYAGNHEDLSYFHPQHDEILILCKSFHILWSRLLLSLIKFSFQRNAVTNTFSHSPIVNTSLSLYFMLGLHLHVLLSILEHDWKALTGLGRTNSSAAKGDTFHCRFCQSHSDSLSRTPGCFDLLVLWIPLFAQYFSSLALLGISTSSCIFSIILFAYYFIRVFSLLV